VASIVDLSVSGNLALCSELSWITVVFEPNKYLLLLHWRSGSSTGLREATIQSGAAVCCI